MKKKKKKDQDIILSFLGGSTESVTGSMQLIQIKQEDGSYRSILIECGAIQTTSEVLGKDLSANRKMLDKLPKEIISTIDFVLLSHAHNDHVGNLGYLNKENGFNGVILGNYKTLEIAKEIIIDSEKIQEKTIQKLKQNGKKVRPLYTKQNVIDMLEHMEVLPVGKKIPLNNRVSIKLIHNNHCYGSVMIQLWIKKLNNQIVSIVYTGDMGSKYNQHINPFNDVRKTIPKCNYLISEGTYNDIERTLSKRTVDKELKRFKETIKEDLLSGKRVLVSSFSFNKGQYLPCLFYEMFHNEDWFNYTIAIDGVLIHKINGVYLKTLDEEQKEYFNKVLSWDKIKKIKTQDSCNAFLMDKTPSIVISTSGFLTQGRIINYLRQYLGSEKCSLVITGYFGGTDSFAGRICNPNIKTIKIEKQEILKRCNIHMFGNAFSGHIQANELINELKGAKCNKLFIHHSDGENKYKLADTIRDEARKHNNTMSVIAVDKDNNEFYL